MSNIEHWIGVRMAAGYDKADLLDYIDNLRHRRGIAQAVLSDDVPDLPPRGAVDALEEIERGHRKIDGSVMSVHYLSVRDCREIARAALAALRGQ